jgi:hypothetical protein
VKGRAHQETQHDEYRGASKDRGSSEEEMGEGSAEVTQSWT